MNIDWLDGHHRIGHFEFIDPVFTEEEKSVRQPIRHFLKCWPEFFQSVKIGDKTADLRKDDRNYRVSDTLFLREYDPKRDAFTGHTCFVTITAVLRDFEGLLPGYCVLSTKLSPDSCRFDVSLIYKSAKQLEEEDKENEKGSVHSG